ncbi:hypothetical protein ACFLUP_02935 [Chloroflexota bacterium]
MFDSIKVHDIKGITTPVTLFGLGKINVICGKNNSGKTSLLEGINNQEKYSVGKQLTEEDIDTILEALISGPNWSGVRRPDHPHVKLSRQILEETANKQEGWFSDEVDSFARDVHTLFARSIIRSRGEGDRKIVFNRIFIEKPSTVLLPSKRVLDLATPVDGNQKVGPNGSGILNYLFFGKNQSNTDMNYKLIDTLSEAFIDISGGYYHDVTIEKTIN